MPNPPKLFISYSHDSPEHQKMVLDLANRFRTEQGIDCQIDQHFLPAFPPEGWTKWMRDQIKAADYVLMVCTPIYRDRYERNVETGGNGVAFEGLIISSILYQGYFSSNKFLPVICDGGDIEHVSLELRGKNIYSMPSDFETLADLIKGKQYNPLPPLSSITPKAQNYQSNIETTTQRNAELAYLNNFLKQRSTSFARDTYVTLSGGYQADKQLMPLEMMPISYRHQSHTKGNDKVEIAAGEVKHFDNLITALEHYQRLVILGEPGAGKTFSLWKIAADNAAKSLQNEAAMIPVFVPLNRWTDDKQSLESFVLEQMGDAAPFFEAMTKQNRLLPLLDALNEIPFEQRKRKLPQVSQWIAKGFSHLIISCRERDYSSYLVQDIDRLKIEPLDPPRIYIFLQNYFRSLHHGSSQSNEIADNLFWQLAGGKSIKDAWNEWEELKPNWITRFKSVFWIQETYSYSLPEREVSSKKHIRISLRNIINLWKPFTKPNWENFWSDEHHEDWYWKSNNHLDSVIARENFFNDSRCLMKLAQNPYLLNLIIFIYRGNEHKLPRNRYKLLYIFVTDLLKRELEENDKVQARNSIPEQSNLLDNLKRLAWQLQRHENRTTVDIQEVIEAEIMTLDEISLAVSASILELTNETIRFSHQLLQEYLTAQSFEERISSGLKASEIWQPSFWWVPNGWEEVAKIVADNADDHFLYLHWLAEGNPLLAVEIAWEKNLLEQKNEIFIDYKTKWQASITDVKKHPNPHERHAISMILARLNWDERQGIGITNDRLPDIKWIEIPKGSFIYGDNDKRKNLSLDTFYISQYPITDNQYQAFIDAGGYENKLYWEGLIRPDHFSKYIWEEVNKPVINVDWFESMAFCRWLTIETGEEIRLPTEQQWEKAFRGTKGNEYPWGNEYISGSANIKDEVYYLGEPSAVGIYPQGKSPYKVFDMAGNVDEWCLNKFEKPEIVTSDISNEYRSVRGGSWQSSTDSCNSAFRICGAPYIHSHSLGFRVVRVIPKN